MQSLSPHIYGVPLDAFDGDRVAFAQGSLALGGKGRPDRTVNADRAFIERATTRFDYRAYLADDGFDSRTELVRAGRATEKSIEDRPRRDNQRDRDDQKKQRLRGQTAYDEQRN